MSLFLCDQFEEFILRQSSDELPEQLGGAGTLRLRSAHGLTQSKVLSYLCRTETIHSLRGNTISARTEDAGELVLQLAGVLSAKERASAQVLFQTERLDAYSGHALAWHSLQNFLAKLRSRWLADLILEGRLYSIFQPVVSCRDEGLVYGYEALMRGTEGGQTIYPEQMLEVARGANLLSQLDRHACRAAIHAAARHRVSTKLFINVTPDALHNADVGVDDALRALDKLRLSPHQIVLEIVESEQFHDLPQLRRVLDLYRAAGFRVGLDDFGSAFSSLRVLDELRPDYLKIDSAVIRDVDTDPFRATLARKLIEAARELGIKTVAEGVETAGEYEWVRENRADFAQGHYISKPNAQPPFMFSPYEKGIAIELASV